jgi:hypothetical protein
VLIVAARAGGDPGRRADFTWADFTWAEWTWADLIGWADLGLADFGLVGITGVAGVTDRERADPDPLVLR